MTRSAEAVRRAGPIPHNAHLMNGASPPTGASQRERAEALQEALAERILVLDGATGTWLQGQDLTAADFGGDAISRAATRTSSSRART